MALEAGGSIQFSSWTVREVKAFEEEFSKIESRIDRAIVALSMLILGPIALSMLILIDAVRGASHLVESLYWRERTVEPQPQLQPPPPPPVIDPAKEILNAAEAKNSRVDSMVLVDRVLEFVQKSKMDGQQAVAFLREVFARVDDTNEFDFANRFEREALRRMREEFFADFIVKPDEAIERFNRMEFILEGLFPRFDKRQVLNEEDIIRVMNAIWSKLRKNLALSMEAQVDEVGRLNFLVDRMKEMGLPKDFEISVVEMHEELFLLAGAIDDLKEKNAPLIAKLQKLDDLGQAIDALTTHIGKEEEAIAALRARLPKKKKINKTVDLSAQPGNSQGAKDFLEKEIKELQKERDLIDEEDQKFAELNQELRVRWGELEPYRAELQDKQAEFAALVTDEFGGVTSNELLEAITTVQTEAISNQHKIEELQNEIARSFSEDDIEYIDDLDEVDSPAPLEISPMPLIGDTPTPSSPSQAQGWGPWLRSWIY